MFLSNLLDYYNDTVSNDILDETINIELEIKVLIDPRIKTPHYIPIVKNNNINDFISDIKNIIYNAIQYGESSLSQTINFIKTNTTDMFVKQLVFVNGIQDKSQKKYYTKSSLIPPVFLVSKDSRQPSYKLSLNKEINKDSDENEFDIVRFRLRYSIEFHNNKLSNWRLDLTLVKETKNQSVEQLKQIRDVLFNPKINKDNFMDVVDWLYPTRIEIELEYIDKDIQLSDISNLDILWNVLYTETRTYNDCVCQIAQIIKPQYLDKFKTGYFGLKQLGNSPIELTYKEYFNIVLNNIDNYILTEKIDGTRSMLILYPQKGICHVINKKYSCIEVEKYSSGDDLIILDSEEYNENGMVYYYVFDVIWCNQNISKYNFCETNEKEQNNINIRKDRLTIIKHLTDKYEILRTKHFIQLNSSNYSQQIHEFYNLAQKLPYETDGIIFISKNANYCDTLNFKWKPIEKSTIDFVAKKCPSSMLGINPYVNKQNKTLYLLFLGIRSNEYSKLGITKIKSYNKLFKKVQYKDKYLPIQFSPSSDPFAYLFWSENPELDNNIVELSRKDNEWVLHKVRTDRKIDMDRKTYYGNYFKYAEMIWMNYQNPLTIENICSPNQQNYFKVDDNKKYKYIRKFNNFVKNHLIKMYTKNYETQWVIDLASGKGQDLFKYIDCGIQNILMIDNDISALTEVVNRKYEYINNKKINTMSKIFIKQIDLTKSFKDILCEFKNSRFDIPLIEKININKNMSEVKTQEKPHKFGVQLIVCNFALHYLIPNKQMIKNFVSLIGNLLKPGGVFIFTAFNGQKVFDLLESNNGEWNYKDGDKLIYSIKKKYTGGFTGTNQKIDVLLPFSNNQYYTEYLINIAYLTNEFEKKKFTLINDDTFNIYLNNFEKLKPYFYKEMTNGDKEFTGLYSFYVFHKK